MSKNEIRREALVARGSLSREAVSSLSKAIEARVVAMPEYDRASTLCSYVAKQDEVQTEAIINRALREGRRVIVPKTEPETRRLVFSEITTLGELEPAQFGILEPASGSLRLVPLSLAGVILVPVVAWDERGYRLGYGRGYYDKALLSKGRGLSVGLAFELQRVSRVPESRDDVPLEALVTERRVVRWGGDEPRI